MFFTEIIKKNYSKNIPIFLIIKKQRTENVLKKQLVNIGKTI